MGDNNLEVKSIKSMLRSVLISSKAGVPAAQLQQDYKEIVGDYIPYKKFGFASFEQFIEAIPDVVRINWNNGDCILHAVADESTAHIQKMVSKQRSKKPKKPVRRQNCIDTKFLSRFLGQGRRPPKLQRYEDEPSTPVHSRHGIPTFITPPKYGTPLTIQIQNSDTEERKVAYGQRVLNVSSPSKYELPPRFKQHMGFPPQQNISSKPMMQSMSPVQNTSGRQSHTSPGAKTSFGKIEDDDFYIEKLRIMLQAINEPMIFNTTYAVEGYVSSIRINNNTFGSEDIFETPRESEAAVAKVAVTRLNIARESDTEEIVSSSVGSQKLNVIKFRVKEILENKKNGLWLTTIPHVYKDRYKEDAPNDLMDIVKTWTDIARVEPVPHTDRDIVYPVLPEENKNNTAQKQTVARPVTTTLITPVTTPVLAPVVSPVTTSVYQQGDVEKTHIEQGKENGHINNIYELYVEAKDKQYSLMKSLTILREPLLKINEEVIVYMTYASSPAYFSVQRADSIVFDVMEKLMTHCKLASSPNPAHLEKGQFCAGIFSGDGNWTRAEILNVKDNDTVELLFVDFGNVECVKVQDVRWLSPEVAAIPCQSVDCSLTGIQPLEGETKYSDAALEFFADIVQDQALIAVPRNHYDDECLFEVELYLQSDRSINVYELLVKSGTVRSYNRPLLEEVIDDDSLHPGDIVLPSDNEWDVYVTFVSAMTESIMIRLVGEEYSDKLDQFQSKLQEAYMNSSTENPIKLDRTYVALDDELYHRVRVITKGVDKVECYFLDHGDTDKLLPEQLHALDPQINCLLPYQAVEVSLYGLEEVCSCITVLEKICDLALGKSCVADVICRGDIPSVVLFDTFGNTDININETILKEILKVDEENNVAKTKVTTPPILPYPEQSSCIIKHVSPSQSSTDISHLVASLFNLPQQNLTITNNFSALPTQNTLSSSPAYSAIVPSSAVNVVEVHRLNDLIANAQSQLYGSTRGSVESVNTLASESTRTSKTSIKSEPSQKSSTSRPILGRSSNRDSHLNPQVFQIPPVGEYFDVHVNFVVDPHDFVCIPYNEMSHLNQLLLDMIQYYTKSPLVSMSRSDILIDKVYAGCSDYVWYRVKIKHVGPDWVSVLLVDIGQYCKMHMSDVQPLVDKFRRLPMMSFMAKLGNIESSIPEKWLEAAKYKFMELANEKDLVGLILGYDSESGIVSLRLIDTSTESYDICIDEVLVKMEFAKCAIIDKKKL